MMLTRAGSILECGRATRQTVPVCHSICARFDRALALRLNCAREVSSTHAANCVQNCDLDTVKQARYGRRAGRRTNARLLHYCIYNKALALYAQNKKTLFFFKFHIGHRLFVIVVSNINGLVGNLAILCVQESLHACRV